MTNGTFLPLYFENQQNLTQENANISADEKIIVPKLNFNRVNQNYNDFYESPQDDAIKGINNHHLKGKSEVLKNLTSLNNESSIGSQGNFSGHNYGYNGFNKKKFYKPKLGLLKQNLLIGKNGINLSILNHSKKHIINKTVVTEMNFHKTNSKSKIDIANTKMKSNKSFSKNQIYYTNKKYNLRKLIILHF